MLISPHSGLCPLLRVWSETEKHFGSQRVASTLNQVLLSKAWKVCGMDQMTGMDPPVDADV